MSEVWELKLKTTSCSPGPVDFMDLTINKGIRFKCYGILDLSLHIKQGQANMYIPFHSYHPRHMFAGFIKAELQRFIIHSSDEAHFNGLRESFRLRLLTRGYPVSFLKSAMQQLQYKDRPTLLKRISDRVEPKTFVLPNFYSLNIPNVPQFVNIPWSKIANESTAHLRLPLKTRVVYSNYDKICELI